VPEGDTIYRLATQLTQTFGGREILQFQTIEPHLAREDIAGRRIERAQAQGKNLFIELSGDLILHSHLQMLGKWKVERPARSDALERAGERVRGEYRPAQLRLRAEHASLVALHLRILKWTKPRDVERVIERLGPDLLAQDYAQHDAVAHMRSAGDVCIALALLRQDLVAGIGNVFKSEVLFLQGIHPLTPVSQLSDDTLAQLLRKTRDLMRRNTLAGPRTTRFALGGPRLWVYERAGEPCLRCGERIVMQRLGTKLRSTYYCPTCQPNLAEKTV
jgi:endonuclease VIII